MPQEDLAGMDVSGLPELVRGWIAGVVIAAPVGAVGVLCIRRALADGRIAAFVAGLGAAVADTFYGAVAGLGLGLVHSFLSDHQVSLRLLGGALLIYIGWRTWRASITLDDTGRTPQGMVQDFMSTLVITLTNPATVIGFMTVFAALGAVGYGNDGLRAGQLILGVFAGSASWWLFLSGVASILRDRITDNWLRGLNHAAGALLVLLGVAVLVSVPFMEPRPTTVTSASLL